MTNEEAIRIIEEMEIRKSDYSENTFTALKMAIKALKYHDPVYVHRCLGCSQLTDIGNCSKYGGFFTAVSIDICVGENLIPVNEDEYKRLKENQTE